VAAMITVAIVAVNPGQVRTVTTANQTSTSANLPVNETSLSTSSYNSSLGLLLTLSISNNTIPRDDGVSIRISLNNNLSEQNTISPPHGNSSSGWTNTFSWNLQPGTTYPVGVEIFQGNYVSNNGSLIATPVNLFAPGTCSGCADHPWAPISFAPLSGNITSPDDWWINQSAAIVEYFGYWGGESTPPFQNDTFSSFPPGIYTVEGEDWWGQVTLVHFQVVANPDPLDCATIASNPAFVKGTNFSASAAGPLKLESYYKDLQGSNNTVALELTTTGTSTISVGMVSLSNPYTSNPNYVYPFRFSPSADLSPQSWQYYAPNGTLSEPAVFFANECSLLLVEFPASYQGVPLALYVGGQMQTFTLNE
jgi:hypothetical protein